jgi:hypothetical protein
VPVIFRGTKVPVNSGGYGYHAVPTHYRYFVQYLNDMGADNDRLARGSAGSSASASRWAAGIPLSKIHSGGRPS